MSSIIRSSQLTCVLNRSWRKILKGVTTGNKKLRGSQNLPTKLTIAFFVGLKLAAKDTMSFKLIINSSEEMSYRTTNTFVFLGQGCSLYLAVSGVVVAH